VSVPVAGFGAAFSAKRAGAGRKAAARISYIDRMVEHESHTRRSNVARGGGGS
jgi:hypothetical protein